MSAYGDVTLTLNLDAMSKHVVVGEPIALHVGLVNSGDEDVRVSAELGQRGNHVTYRVTTPNGDVLHLPGPLSERSAPLVTLEPGETLHHIEWVLVNLNATSADASEATLVAGTPGIYTFHVEYRTQCPNSLEWSTHTSPPVTVDVKPPQNQWQGYLDLIKLYDVALLIENGPLVPGSVSRMSDGEARKASVSVGASLSTLAAAEAPYAPYAALLLGSIELSPNDFGLKRDDLARARRERAERAFEYLVFADTENFPLRGEAVWYMREAAMLLDNAVIIGELEERLGFEFADDPAGKRFLKERQLGRQR
jgi:hypothetical protein